MKNGLVKMEFNRQNRGTVTYAERERKRGGETYLMLWLGATRYQAWEYRDFDFP